jgi:ATP-dependent DNA helicase DinG
LSLVGFRSWLRHSNLCKKKELIGKVTDLIKTLNGGDTPEGFNQTATTKALIRRQFEGFHKSIAGARKGLDENTRWYCDVLSRIVKAQDSWIGLSFSETRRFPTISSGPCSVSWLLHRIWDGVASAVLVSGTLVVPSGDESGLSYWYSKMKLALPDARYRAVGPITMSWVYSSPKLMVPHPDDCAALSYPQSVKKKALSSEELEADTEVVEKDADPRYVAWADAVARVILKAANTSKGGGLVLCTSYKDIEAFKDRLSISLGDRLISQSRLTGFASAHAKFLELTAKKKRPFWLATGPAWTGLDLSDPNIAAEDDFIVTDLIMPRMPYGLNRSSTHWHLRGRVKRVDLTEAAAQARQGTGRLIRREGLTHRRLWMLDGRIFTGARPAFTPLRALLRPYKNVEQFKIT